jgi:succinyl-diaminopimelate desuccinylase
MKKVLQNRIEHLIRFASTESQRDEQRACAEWIVKELKKSIRVGGVRMQIVTHNGVPSVVAMRGAWKQPEVLLNGHFDVVEAPQKQFKAITKGDRIYGRGAADMKGGVAALMTTFIEIINTTQLSIGLILTGDEEVGGFNGTAWLVEQGWKPKTLINFDGGYGEQITHAEKGILRFSITAQGKAALASYLWEGKCAFEKMIHAYKTLHTMYPERHEATSERNWITTFAPTSVCTTSRNHKTMIDSATMNVSINFTENITPQALLKKIQQRLPGMRMKTTIMAPRVWIRPNHPEILRFQKIYAKHLGRTPNIRGENGSSDARFFTHMNIPIIITKPVGGNPELDGEWVSVRSVEKLTRATIDFLREY